MSAAGGAPARAADLLLLPPAAPAWTWDGIYLGGHAGYAWAHDPLQQPLFSGQSTPSLGDINSQGPLAGFQAGANWQSGAWLGGLEFDISASRARGSSSAAGSGTMPGGLAATESLSSSEQIDMLGSGRVRFGYLLRPDLLLYGTGGLGWARVDLSSDQTTTMPVLGTTSSSVTLPSWRFGWVAGVGAETRLANTDWLARLEYLHYDFGGAADSTTTTIIGGVATTSIGNSGPMTVDLVRAGLSYKFGDASAAGRAGSGPYAWAPSTATTSSSSISTSPWNWTGFYMGAHAGYGWTRDRIDQFFGNGVMHGIDGQGGLAGVQAGANWQRGTLVGGLEIDASATDIRGQNGAAGTSTTPFLTTSQSGTDGEKFHLLGSARARLGYLVSPTTLLYGTGGLAWTEIQQSAASVGTTTTVGFPATTTTTISNATAPSWRFGWVAGLGAEQRIGDTNWIGRLEYLHYDFGETGSISSTVTTGGTTTITPLLASNHLTADILRAGASYRLGGDNGMLPTRVRKAPAPADWSGFYVGVHGGGGIGNDPFNIGAGLPQLPDVNSSGWLAGGHAGANWQAGRWLAGIEADVSTTGIKGSSAATLTTVVPETVSESLTDSFELLGSARARLGWLPWPNLVVYGTGGLAWTQLLQAVTDETSVASIDSTVAETVESWRWGWAAGLGAETRIGQSNWLGRVEYLHYDFGKSSTSTTVSSVSATVASEGVLTADILRVGLSYQLN